MHKVLVLSDTHGNHDILDSVLLKNRNANYLIHLGDEPDDLERHKDLLENMQVYSVYGLYHHKFSPENACKTFSIDDINFVIAHAREYLIPGPPKCFYCYGHTHRGFIEQHRDVVYLNPGHLKHNIDRNEIAGYVVIEISQVVQVFFYDFRHAMVSSKIIQW